MVSKVKMYGSISTSGCNLEIMGYPFYAEEISPTEAFRRRDYNYNNIVGGTATVNKGPYVPMEYTVTTHVKVRRGKPYMYDKVFEEMMSKPVRVVSPELHGAFYAIVVIKPEYNNASEYLKLTINIKEVPGRKSKIPGEEFVVPATRKITYNEDGTPVDEEEDSVDSGSKRNSVPRKSKSN